MTPPQGQAGVKGFEGYGKNRDLAAAAEFEFDEFLCWTRIGGLENPQVLSAMELMGGEVIPAVRKATTLKADQ